MNRGQLIVFEGIDGVGKSTQLDRLAATLRERGHAVLCTREPTEGPHGRAIRESARAGRREAPERELALFVADRREHVASVITPALRDGQVVLCDRYFLSTVAYQGARGLDPDALLRAAEAEFPLPDLALLFRLDAARALRRVTSRGPERDAGFEEEDNLRAVAEVFDRLDRPYLTRVDAAAPADEVAAAVLAAVDERIRALA